MNNDDYWAIAERNIEIGNPVTDRKLRLLDDYCDIRDGLKVLDVGCGKAWVMRGWAERFAIEGTGLETNQHFLKFARGKPATRGRLSYLSGPARDFPAPAFTTSRATTIWQHTSCSTSDIPRSSS